jgi:hypothetical protein
VEENKDTVKVNSVLYELMNTANSLETQKNNLKEFKEFLETSEDFAKYSSAVQYRYDTVMDVYVKDPDEKIVKTDIDNGCNRHGIQRGLSVAHTSESTRQKIIEHDHRQRWGAYA